MTTRICFISGHYFGFRALQGILSSDVFSREMIKVSLLLTLKDIKRKSTVGFYDFDAFVRKYNLPHLSIRSIKNNGVAEIIKAAKPDFLLVIGWSELLPTNILNIPSSINNSHQRHANTHGCIGMHPTLLPQGRGRAPIPWTIIKGLRKTGVSVFLLEEEADAGGIILQKQILVEREETATTLFNKCAEVHENLAKRLAKNLVYKTLLWTKQNPKAVSIWPKRKPDDGLIDFNKDGEEIVRFIRALTKPYPGAFFFYNGQKIIVHKASFKSRFHRVITGTIKTITKNGLPLIAVNKGFLECEVINPMGIKFISSSNVVIKQAE